MPDLQATRTAPASLFPLAKADLCVKCGLCLPHCPTYQETGHEADSPRGRIALLQGLASGLITQTPSLHTHLDGCLSCRSCERVCPAKVPYGELIDSGRALLAKPQRAAALSRWLAPWLRHAALRSVLRWKLRVAPWLLPSWLPLPLFARRWRSLLPRPAAPITVGRYQAATKAIRVALFRGCVGDVADRETLRALGTLLQRCGLQVDDARGQTCCGALQQHAGESGTLRSQLQQNLAAFAEADRITYAASGCGATLQEYGLIDPAAQDFARRVHDPHRLLLEHWPARIQLRSLPARVALHLPCTQTNVTGGDAAMRTLLAKIPGLQVLPMNTAHPCCGAAGTYFLTQPAMADRLLDHKLDELAALKPELLLSSNIGCSLRLAAGLSRRGLTVPVVHPLALLAQQWPDA